MKLYKLTIQEAMERLGKKDIRPAELVTSVFERINDAEHEIGAYLTLTYENAMEQADQAEKAILKGEASPLTGIPLSLKDLICTEGVKTTCASKILENFVPSYDATVVEKLKKQNAVFTGKTNMDEFAMGTTTESSAFKITKNPWNRLHSPGGSSGGSAASVAAGMCLGSIGSDTGGSIRIPASHCGLVGLKPTYGRVSRYGAVPLASSLDQIGPLARNVKDAALILNAISGHDPFDSASVQKKVPDFTENIGAGVNGLKIGIPREYFNCEELDSNVRQSVEKAIETFKSLGAELVDISMPNHNFALSACYVISTAEASSGLAKFDGVRYGFRAEDADELHDMYRKTRTAGFGLEVKRRIIIGNYFLSSECYDAYFKKASQVRTLVIDDFRRAFEKCDIILTPVSPTVAAAIGEHKETPLKAYLSDMFTVSANLAGLPALSVPCGFTKENLPVGLHLMGRHFDEETILRAAFSYEQTDDFHMKRPEL